MQIRCFHCHRPFALGKEEIYAALDMVEAEQLNHFNAHCPHCSRVNRVSHKDLLKAAPDWTKQPREGITDDTHT